MVSSLSLSSPTRVFFLDLSRTSALRHAYIADLARFLSQLPDFRPVLAVPSRFPVRAMVQQNIEYCMLPSSLAWDPRSLARLSRLASAHTPCLVHSHDPNGAALAAALIRRLPGALMLHTLYSAPAPGNAKRKEAWRKAHALVVPSEFLRDAYSHAALDPKHIRCIRPGLDPERCPRRQERNDGRLVFMALAPETGLTGWNTLIKAMVLLAGRTDLPPWELRVAGKGTYLPSLLDLAKSLGVEHRLALFGEQDHYAFLPQADILLAPSGDTMEDAVAIQQAWAAKIPVIATNLPANLELLCTDKNGLTYPSADPDALANQMARLALDQNLRCTLTAFGHSSLAAITAAHAAAEHGWLYRELLDALP